MFNRCRAWRRKLSLRADGALPIAQRGALEDHLARCPRCRAAEAADSALRSVLGIHTGMLDTEAARIFDQKVLTRVEAARAAAGRRSAWNTYRSWAQARWNALPFAFFTQIAGGALVAASITALCLLPALHTGVSSDEGKSGLRSGYNTPANSEAPEPLEALLQSQKPRAALLWRTRTLPGARHFAPGLQSGDPASRDPDGLMPDRLPTSTPNAPERHSAAKNSVVPG